MLVEVRPLPRTKWHGKKNKESFSQPKAVEVLYNSETGKYDTGLTPEEAAKFGKELGIDLSDNFNPNEAHPYWSTKASWVVLKNQTMLFDTNKVLELIKIKNMRASKLVANSMREWEENKWPDATHVIFDENEEVDARATKGQLKRKAMIAADKMSIEDKISMVQILSSKSVRGRSPNHVEVEIDDLIETKPSEFLRFLEMGKEEVYARAAVLECLYKNILTKEGSAVYYMGELIGIDTDAAVDWFKNPQNSKIKVAILEKLNK